MSEDSIRLGAPVSGSPAATPARRGTFADLMTQIGSVPLERIPFPPAPGAATEADVLAGRRGEKRLYELVDGVLVEKPMGYYESLLAGLLLRLLWNFLDEHDLGVALGADGTLRLAPGLVRIPDVSFLAWKRFPGRRLPAEPIPDLAPDLAVEILSEGNTAAEMDRKVSEYFNAGARLVWLVDPPTRTARVFTAPGTFSTIAEAGELDGGDVLPGFRIRLREWFDRAGTREPRRS